jgi:hypothetical protein
MSHRDDDHYHDHDVDDDVDRQHDDAFARSHGAVGSECTHRDSAKLRPDRSCLDRFD